MDGFLNINKPAGLSSHDVVSRVRRWSGQKQVGHGGTLDPLATGVLPIALGYATRLFEFCDASKVYRATVRFGVTTDTYDAEGLVLQERDPNGLDRTALEYACRRFVGDIDQRPPSYSAIKQSGRPAYRLARQGQLLQLPERRVHVASIDLLDWTAPEAVLQVACGSGTYVRSLAHDLGQLLGVGAHLTALQRLQSGPFLLDTAADLDRVGQVATSDEAALLLLPTHYPIRHWPEFVLDAKDVKAVLQGQDVTLPYPTDATVPGAEHARAHECDGRLLALLRRLENHTDRWHPFKVFPGAGSAVSLG